MNFADRLAVRAFLSGPVMEHPACGKRHAVDRFVVVIHNRVRFFLSCLNALAVADDVRHRRESIRRQIRIDDVPIVRSVADTHRGGGTPLITTDGFKFYAPAIRHVFGVGCVLAQVIKKIKRNRVVRVGAKLIVGTEWRLADALEEPEDSTKLNTAFIERLNLTIRQGCAYLRRRSPCHARKKRTLTDHLELFRCFYNFVRPHSALRFGKVTRTPAIQAGLATKRLSFRDIFTARYVAARFAIVRSGPLAYHESTERVRCAA